MQRNFLSRDSHETCLQLFCELSVASYREVLYVRYKNWILDGHLVRFFHFGTCIIFLIFEKIWNFWKVSSLFDQFCELALVPLCPELGLITHISCFEILSTIYIYIRMYIYIKIQRFSVHYLRKSELLNWLHLFMDQFVCYIHRKVCSLSSV